MTTILFGGPEGRPMSFYFRKREILLRVYIGSLSEKTGREGILAEARKKFWVAPAYLVVSNGPYPMKGSGIDIRQSTGLMETGDFRAKAYFTSDPEMLQYCPVDLLDKKVIYGPALSVEINNRSLETTFQAVKGDQQYIASQAANAFGNYEMNLNVVNCTIDAWNNSLEEIVDKLNVLPKWMERRR